MSFQPVIPMSGYAGWRFLQRTLDSQKEAFVQSAPLQRNTTYFRENIAKVQSAEDLVKDRRLLAVALGAFGLDDDINNKAFIRKVLEDGTIKERALSSRLADKRYADFARSFGFGDFGSKTQFPGFADSILARYETKQFEAAVGAQDDQMRQALNLSAGLAEVVRGNSTKNGQWYAIMGNAPLRSVVQTALGFPSSFARVGIDQQLDAFKDRARAVFGTDNVGDLTRPEAQEKMIRLFMIRSDAAAASATSPGSVALSLLQARR
ncbi:MAG: DUF1217 domain-containing protein [Rhodobacterales bacterium]|nr:DUF1217 domain-containing protein [Rhodobacterales bacterium]NCT11204.1 DUF1217 domain-containing protein [Rhodobacterales bacterium]